MKNIAQSSLEAADFPATVCVGGSTLADRLDWIAAHKEELNATLLRIGAARFAGLGAETPDEFEQLAERLFDRPRGYVGGDSPRTRVSGRVYTSTEYPASQAISLHNEMSYATTWPAQLLFGCIVAAEEGGETPIADSRDILRALDPAIVDEFAARGVCYIRNLPNEGGFGRSWQATFETTDRAVVERVCQETDSEFEWKSDGALRLVQRRPAVAVHPITGERVWFNQAEHYHPSSHPSAVYEALIGVYGDDPDALPSNATFGDGTPFPVAMLASIRKTIEELTVTFPWRVGDALLLDNMLACHGRRPYRGARRVLVSMA